MTSYEWYWYNEHNDNFPEKWNVEHNNQVRKYVETLTTEQKADVLTKLVSGKGITLESCVCRSIAELCKPEIIPDPDTQSEADLGCIGIIDNHSTDY